MKVLVMTGKQTCNGQTVSASILIDGKPLDRVLTFSDTPERLYVKDGGGESKWCIAVYNFPRNFNVDFIAKCSDKADILRSFNTENCQAIDVDGHACDGEVLGFIRTFNP